MLQQAQEHAQRYGHGMPSPGGRAMGSAVPFPANLGATAAAPSPITAILADLGRGEAHFSPGVLGSFNPGCVTARPQRLCRD